MKSRAANGAHAERAADVVEDPVGAGFAGRLRSSHLRRRLFLCFVCVCVCVLGSRRFLRGFGSGHKTRFCFCISPPSFRGKGVGPLVSSELT